MLLAIDCGNTNTVFAVFEGDDLHASWRISTDAGRTADEYAVWLTQLMTLDGLGVTDIDQSIIATVVPAKQLALAQLVERFFAVPARLVGDPAVALGIEVLIDRPEQVGADRLVNAIAAHQKYTGDLIVIDFGTGTTFDIVDAAGNYRGGVIAPGIHLAAEALFAGGAQLPRVAIEKPATVIGSATAPAMQSGLFWGYVSMIEGMVPRIVAEFGKPMRVIATGGLAPLFADVVDVIEASEPDLTLRGLVEIARRNAAR